VKPDDLYRLTWADDPRISPDGRTAAFSAWRLDRDENEYAAAIWLAQLDGEAEPRQFTAGKKLDVSPRWSPDGTRLAFTSNRDGEAKQLFVIPVEGGEPLRLTELDEDVTEVAWSPDGTRLAFTSRVRDPEYDEEDEKRRKPRRFSRLQFKLDSEGWTGDRRRHLFTVAADGSSPPRQLTDGDYEDRYAAWSPDGQKLAFVSARQDDWDIELVRHIYVVDAEGGEPVQLTEGESSYAAPAWSPDGAEIACRYSPGGFNFPRHGQIAVIPAAGGPHRLLTTSLDLNCAPYPEIREPVWDGGSLLFVVEHGGNNHLYRARADGSTEPEVVLGGELWLTGFDHAGGQLVHCAATPTEPPELFSGERRLSHVGSAFDADVERFSAVSADGSEVDAWIMRPLGFEQGRRYPVLLNIHGGPFAQYGNKFFDEFQVYAGAGYVVLFANPRGSSGYSEEWGRAINGPVEGGPGWGTRDYEDLMAVVDEALERFDFCDPDRLGVIGGSYGGYMTSWIVGHTDRFRAACSERSVNNFIIESSADIGWAFKGQIGAHWFEAPEAYLKASPSTYAENIKTPLMILHSEEDLRCPVAHAEELFAILRLLRREVELVRFPAESHELTRAGSPAHRVMRFEVILEWFDRYLQPPETRAGQELANAKA
jgi:dipeptidyl aminopeptidase/acylaminoacyl peptidase